MSEKRVEEEKKKIKQKLSEREETGAKISKQASQSNKGDKILIK